MLNLKTVRALRKKKKKENGRKFTQADMAEALRISISTYGRIERGNNVPSIDTVGKMAQILDSSVEQLCTLNLDFKQNNHDDNAQPEQSQVQRPTIHHHHHHYYGNEAIGQALKQAKKRIQDQSKKINPKEEDQN